MFSCLARGVGAWTGEIAQDQQPGQPGQPGGVRNSSASNTESAVAPSALNFDDGVHRHGITVSSHSIASSGKVDNGEFLLPRTFTTRKGALMLFSDDGNHAHSECGYLLNSAKASKTHLLQEEIEKLGSLSRLSSSVLTFGDEEYDDETCSISNPENKVLMKFLKSFDGVDVDLSVQPGRNTNDYLRSLKIRLLKARIKAGEMDLTNVGNTRLVRSASSISGLQAQDFIQELGIQRKSDLPSISRTSRKAESKSVSPVSYVGQQSTNPAWTQNFDDTSQSFWDRSPTVCLSNESSPKHGRKSSYPPMSVHIRDQSPYKHLQTETGSTVLNGAVSKRPHLNVSRTLDLGSDEEENEALKLAYGILKDYDGQDSCGDTQSSEFEGPDVSVESNPGHPLMPAYDSSFDGLPGIAKSFPLEVSQMLLSSDPKPPKVATVCVNNPATSFVSSKNQPRKRSAFSLSRQSSAKSLIVREVKSAGYSARSQRSAPRISRADTTKSGHQEPNLVSVDTSTIDKKPKEQKAEISNEKSETAKNMSKSLQITRMRTPSGREKRQEPLSVRATEDKENVQRQDIKVEKPEIDSEKIQATEVPNSNSADAGKKLDSGEAKRTTTSSARKKFKKIKGTKGVAENDVLRKKNEIEKSALRESRRKDNELKKLFAEERLAEEKRLEEYKRLAEGKRLEEEEKLMEKRGRDEEDIAALAAREAQMQEEILEAQRRAEEAREAEEAARTALAATWSIAREHREAQRRANIEQRKQTLMEQNLKEKQRIEVARRKAQDLLEKIGSAEEVRRFKEAERLRKEELELSHVLKLEEEERLAAIAFEKEEERYIEMERDAEEAAMTKLVQERLDAERRPGLLKEKQRKLKSEGLKKKNALLIEAQEREEKLKKMEEERRRLEEEAKEKLIEMKRLEEEAAENAKRIREARRSAAFQRREHNLENSNHLDMLRHDQTSLNQPWAFSYYVHWPRETFGKLIGQGPRKPGFRPPQRHSARK